MTKICGLVSDNPNLHVPEVLDRMYDASWHSGYVRRGVWSDGPVGLGHFSIGAVNTEPQPLFDASRNAAIVYCGKIFDYDRLRSRLRQLGRRFELRDNDAEFLLQLLLASEIKHLPELNGVFSLAWWNGSERTLTLINDRYGLRPVYYYHDAKRGLFVFSSDLRGVVESGAVQREVNWRGCSTFLHFGHHLGDDTSFRNVNRLPPGSALRFQDNTVSITRYWDMADIAIDDRLTHEDAVAGCADLFAQAVRRRVAHAKGRLVVFLSGGLDSRRIAAQLKREGAAFTTYTTRGFHPVSEEGVVAQEVAEALGLENTFVDLPPDFVTRYWPRSNALCDYETSLHQAFLPLVDGIPGDLKVNFDGIGGDVPANAVLRDSVFFGNPEIVAASRTWPVERLAETLMPDRGGFSVLAPTLCHRLSVSDALDAVVSELRRYERTPNQLTCFYLLNRTRRAIALAPMKLILMKSESFFPFFDNDLFDFTLSIPIRFRVKGTIRQDVIDRVYPELRDLRTAARNPKETSKPRRDPDFGYYRQKRAFIRQSLWGHFLRNNWLFNNVHAGPRVLYDVVRAYRGAAHLSYVFNVTFTTFYEWLEEYFPRGEGIA